MPLPPFLSDENIINLPSGENEGSSLFPLSVIWLRAEPSGEIIKIWCLPETLPTNTIFLLSGDQLGEVLYEPSNVTLLVSYPLLFIIYIWGVPPRSDTNATSFPSGETAGEISIHLAEVILVSFESEILKLYKPYVSSCDDENIISSPSGEKLPVILSPLEAKTFFSVIFVKSNKYIPHCPPLSEE